MQKSEEAIVNLKSQIADLKGKINNSSYKHNSSKMQSLNTLDSQLKDMSKSLNSSKSNINSKQKVDIYHRQLADPKLHAADAEDRRNHDAAEKAYKKADYNYSRFS